MRIEYASSRPLWIATEFCELGSLDRSSFPPLLLLLFPLTCSLIKQDCDRQTNKQTKSFLHPSKKKKTVDLLPWRLKIKMCLEIAMALEYLHTRSSPIIHRDLKSANILV